MKLFLISQHVNQGYDTYDSAVVAAESHADAKKIHPSDDQSRWTQPYSRTWASKPVEVSATLIGEAKPGTKAGVILASFNAG